MADTFDPPLNAFLRRLEGNATAPATVVPFGSAAVADDTILHIVGFLIVLVAAHPMGLLFPKFLKLPLITGYLLMGIVTGPFVANLLTTKTVELLASSINAMALSFISFQAGQEIYLPELKPQIKGILQLLTALYVVAMVLLTVVMTLGAGPFFYGSFDTSCKLAIALLFGSIAVLGSPATVMAIKIELNSVGPFTNLMLGATMTAEFVVLISFSIARVISSVYCAKLDITITNLLFTMGIVFSNLLVGALIGLLIIAIFLIPGGDSHHHNHHQEDKAPASPELVMQTNRGDVVVLSNDPHDKPRSQGGLSAVLGSLYFKGFLWLFMGYIFYISTNTISQLTIAAYGHVWDVKFEPLLVLMVGSCLAGHHPRIRHDMHVILDAAAPFIFLPFFVMTGAGLKLDQVADAIPLMSLFVSLRYVAIFLACYGAGRFILKLTPQQYNNLWLTMTPQAGVALGLANEIKGLSSDPWASEFAATIVAAVVVNQIIGPVLCAMGLSRAGESSVGAKTTEEESHNQTIDEEQPAVEVDDDNASVETGGLHIVRRAVVIGDNDAACELALQLTLLGAIVSMPLLDGMKLQRWDAIREHALQVRTAPSMGGTLAPIGLRPHQEEQEDNHDESELMRSRVAVTETSPDLVALTGDSLRVLEHVKMLQSMPSIAPAGRKKPRFVAIVSTSDSIDALRQRGVVCLHSSMALANAGLRLGLMDEAVVQRYAAVDASESDWVNTSASDPQRVLTHRRRVLQRNVLAARHLPSVVLAPQQPTNMPPQRVSMFGRSSSVAFIGSRRGGQSSFVVPNEVYVMNGGRNGDGAFEEDDWLALSSARSARVPVAKKRNM